VDRLRETIGRLKQVRVFRLSQSLSRRSPPLFDCSTSAAVIKRSQHIQHKCHVYRPWSTTTHLLAYWQLLRAHIKDSRLTLFVPNRRAWRAFARPSATRITI